MIEKDNIKFILTYKINKIYLYTNACHIKKARVLSKIRGDIYTRSRMLQPFNSQWIEKQKVCF